MLIVGQGALARPDGAPILSLAAKAAVVARRRQGRLERLWRAAYRGGARRRARSRLRAGRGRPDARQMASARRARCAVPSRRRRDRHRAGRLRRLSWHAWRPRRARADVILPGAAYTGKVRHSTSTPKAACSWPTRAAFPPGDAREDWAILRALSDVLGQAAAVRFAGGAAAALFAAYPHFAAHRRDRAGRCRAMCGSSRRRAAPCDKAPFALARRRFLSHQPDRARLGGDGGMFGASPRPRAATAAE